MLMMRSLAAMIMAIAILLIECGCVGVPVGDEKQRIVKLSLKGDLEITIAFNPQNRRMVGWYVTNVENKAVDQQYLATFMYQTVRGDYKVSQVRDGKVAINLHPQQADDNIVLRGQWEAGGTGVVYHETVVGPYDIGIYRVVE